MSQFTSGNQVTLLCNGTEYFPTLISAIDDAKYEIYLQTYIYELDKTGKRVGEALKAAALRGVSVYLLLDGFGARKLSKTFIESLKALGVEVLFFRPKISPWTLKRSRLRRLHSKLTVIDGVTAFVGGINVIDDFNTPSHTPPRKDYAVKVKGALLKEMRVNAKAVWKRVCQRQFVKTRKSKLKAHYLNNVADGIPAKFLIRDNFKHRRDIENAYLAVIESAKSEITIANAYFLPGLRFRHALREAAERGVTVKLLLQQRTEYPFLDFATRALYSSLLNQGIQIFEYHKSHMHSKVAVIDQQFAIVGSSNIDPFSLLLSIEANVIVEDAAFATQLQQHLANDINTGATLMTIEKWHRDHYFKRFISWVVYLFLKLMLALVGDKEKS